MDNQSFDQRALDRRQFFARMGVLSVPLLSGASAWADTYPSRPITLVVPYAAGGPTDTHVRAVAEAAGKLLGVSLVIDNKPGSNGVNAAAQMPRTAADGYTLAVLPASVYREPHMLKTPFDPRTSFSYIAMLSDYAFGFAVRADAPWKTWQDFVADARKRPGQINVGATGAVGTPRIVMDEAAEKSGVQFNVVPFKGDADLATALLGGHVDAAPLSGVAVPHIAAGKMRYLAMLTGQRVKRYPDLPTLRELGVDVYIDSPYGVAGPANLPPAMVQKLTDAFKAALQSPESLRALEALNQTVNYMTPAAYREYAMAAYTREGERVAKLRQRGLIN